MPPNFFSENHFKPLKIDINNSLNSHFLRFWPLLVQNGHFLKISNLCAWIGKPILIFWKKIWGQNFIFLMCSFEFYEFFSKQNTLTMFSRIILKNLKKHIFFKQHAGFTPILKFVFDINVAHLKMVYRCLVVSHMTYNCIKFSF